MSVSSNIFWISSRFSLGNLYTKIVSTRFTIAAVRAVSIASAPSELPKYDLRLSDGLWRIRSNTPINCWLSVWRGWAHSSRYTRVTWYSGVRGRNGDVDRINCPRGIDHHGVPGMRGAIVAQIEKDFGEEPRVQLGVELKLDFDKEQRPVGLVVRRLQHAIHPKGGLFEFIRRKVIVCRSGVGCAIRSNNNCGKV